MHLKAKGNPQEFKEKIQAKSDIKVELFEIGETYTL